jgi:cytidine deaminase
MASIHAEVNAMHKLPYLPRHKRPKKVDLLVIRVNRGGSMGNSKPCLNCVQQMNKFLPMKGYTLDTIYYTTQNGIIVSEKFTDLLNSDTPYLSRFYKNKASGKM